MEEKEFNNNEFKQTRLIIVLVAIIVILVFALGFLLGAKQNDKSLKPNKEKIENKNKESKKKDDNNKQNTSAVDNLEDYVGIPMGFCTLAFNFEEKNVELKDLSDKEKIYMLVSFLLAEDYKELEGDYEREEEKELKDGFTYAKEYRRIREFKKEDAKKYFEDVSFLDRLDKIEEGYVMNSVKKINGKYYVVQYIGGCEGVEESGDGIIFAGSRKEDNHLIRTYRYYSYTTDFDKGEVKRGKSVGFYGKYYKDSKKKILLAEEIFADEELEPYYEKMNTYDFYYDISNGNIRFEKIIFNENKE